MKSTRNVLDLDESDAATPNSAGARGEGPIAESGHRYQDPETEAREDDEDEEDGKELGRKAATRAGEEDDKGRVYNNGTVSGARIFGLECNGWKIAE